MTQTEALKMALEEMKAGSYECAIDRLEEVLAQPEQEPAFYAHDGYLMTPERAKFLGFPLDSILALYTTQPQPKAPPEQWRERWYGSLAQKGWWICCGREHIAHLGTEVSSDEVRKIVDAHNRYKLPAQPQEPEQQSNEHLEPVAWRFTGIAGLKRYMTQKQYDAQTPETKKWYEPFKCVNCTTPPHQKPLTDEQFQAIKDSLSRQEGWDGEGWAGESWDLALKKAIEAAHNIKE